MNVLYEFPKQTIFGRILPKSKIYEHGSVTSTVKELFVREVEKITWSYKLSPETINLPAKGEIQEIQVFTIALKTGTLKYEILQSIDKAIPSPILFILSFNNKMRYVAAYKRQNEADKSKQVVSSYFETDWVKQDFDQGCLPVALDLGMLYEKLLLNLINETICPYEKFKEFINRLEILKVKEKELLKLKVRIKKEKQFNRRVELNREFNELKFETRSLKDE